jgi:hypothetical protein
MWSPWQKESFSEMSQLSRFRKADLKTYLDRQFLFRLLIWHMAGGAIIGIFVLFPVNEFVYYHEHSPEAESARSFVFGQLGEGLKGQAPQKTIFYGVVGAMLGVIVSLFNRVLFERTQRINRLMAELEKDLNAIIAKGEHNTLEFKSSLRWDLRQDKLNRALENSVLKTLAGYMNAEGGTLLIGVADDGQVLGLENDYQSLKKKDRDGFEQAIMGAISARMGTDLCTLVQAVFHSMEGKDVCRLITSPAPRPVYVTQDNETRFYLRTGPGTRELNIQEAIEYISNRWS